MPAVPSCEQERASVKSWRQVARQGASALRAPQLVGSRGRTRFRLPHGMHGVAQVTPHLLRSLALGVRQASGLVRFVRSRLCVVCTQV